MGKSSLIHLKRLINKEQNMTYCWEIYNNNSKCETCKHYLAFQAGTLKIEEVKDIVVVEDDDNK